MSTVRSNQASQQGLAPETVGQQMDLPGKLPLSDRAIGWTWAQSLRLMCASWRKQLVGHEVLDQLTAQRRPHIVTFWHRKYVALMPIFQGRHACVVTSASRHGNVIANICHRFGNAYVQIPDHGRDHSFNLMSHAISHSYEASIAVDGPEGPCHVVKRGAVQLASELGYSIVPVSIASRRKHIFVHRWDHLEIPKLFTRVCMVIGDPMTVPSRLGPEDVQSWSNRLHDNLKSVDERAEGLVLGTSR